MKTSKESDVPTRIRQCDLLVYGGTPAGVVCAVRAAREGLSVALVNHTRHLGGMMANGLVQWDALSAQRRCPLFDEILARTEAHYRKTFGEGSPQHLASQYTVDTYPVSCVEPRIIERILTEMTAAEGSIRLQLGFFPQSVNRAGGRITSVVFRKMESDETIEIRANTVADASYEADLAALAGVPYSVGREAFGDFGEPHAGVIYTNIDHRVDDPALLKRLTDWKIFPRMHQAHVHPDSPRTGDRAVQAYNMRPAVTRDPANRVLLDSPPAGYNRDEFVDYIRKQIGLGEGHQRLGKSTYNAAILPGENWDYPEGDWAARRRITERHTQFALGLMWFLQHDKSRTDEQRRTMREWGLCRDEFMDNDHIPWEMYVRETRRIAGRHVLTEQDLTADTSTGLARSFDDSVAFVDWYMDSHSCSHDATFGRPMRPDYPYDGKLVLMKEMGPGQIPYRCLLPRGVDNLIVPVCISTTHVAWGAVRLEPCFVHLGEVAGFAAAFAAQNHSQVADLDAVELVRRLRQNHVETVYPLLDTKKGRDVAQRAHGRRRSHEGLVGP